MTINPEMHEQAKFIHDILFIISSTNYSVASFSSMKLFVLDSSFFGFKFLSVPMFAKLSTRSV